MAAHWVSDVDIAAPAITDQQGRSALFLPLVAIDCDSGVAPRSAYVGGWGFGLWFMLAPVPFLHHSAGVVTPL